MSRMIRNRCIHCVIINTEHQCKNCETERYYNKPIKNEYPLIPIVFKTKDGKLELT